MNVLTKAEANALPTDVGAWSPEIESGASWRGVGVSRELPARLATTVAVAVARSGELGGLPPGILLPLLLVNR